MEQCGRSQCSQCVMGLIYLRSCLIWGSLTITPNITAIASDIHSLLHLHSNRHLISKHQIAISSPTIKSPSHLQPSNHHLISNHQITISYPTIKSPSHIQPSNHHLISNHQITISYPTIKSPSHLQAS